LSPDFRQISSQATRACFQRRGWFAHGAEECNHNPCLTPIPQRRTLYFFQFVKDLNSHQLKTDIKALRFDIDFPQFLVEADGIEPTTSCLQSRRSPN